jgi:hypothetical protein
MGVKKVFSSHIEQVGYEPATQSLTVIFKNGKTATYTGVPPDVASNVVDAPSVGSALHQFVRGKYDHSYEGDEKDA